MRIKDHRKIGQGAFSSVYRQGNSQEVLIVSKGHVKECMALGGFPKSRFFPNVKRVNDIQGESSYRMKFYPKVAAPKKELQPKDYELYKALRALPCAFGDNRQDGYSHWRKQFKALPDKFKAAKRALIGALEALTNYGSDICFEISPRNITRTATGRLILLDCFFIHSQLWS